ncbi:MAG: anhydro-N-acetylmuramic acid kinase, partial [Planctomycetota bacterium]
MGLNPIPLPGAPALEPGQPLRVAGVLSGTSADGIDVALVEIAWSPGRAEGARLVAFASEPFEPELAGRVRRVLDGEAIGLGETAYLHRDLGLAFGGAVARLGREQDWAPHIVGSHGQTVWHHDGEGGRGPASLQLGDGDFVAEAAGAGTVSDFRQADMAAGGDGAPLSAYADDLVFREAGLPLAVLNLGGMGNLSWLDGEKVLAFDTGPAGALLDGLARKLLGQPMDR